MPSCTRCRPRPASWCRALATLRGFNAGERPMSEDLQIRIPRDDDRIDVTDLKEVDYWTEWFGVSEERLRTAVASAGTQRDDLRIYLGLP
jgi:hypothetical protein